MSDLAERYPGWFVSDYAGTNVAEDLAETFTRFVLYPRPTGSRVADAKVNFFWSDPTLVAVRATILANRSSR